MFRVRVKTVSSLLGIPSSLFWLVTLIKTLNNCVPSLFKKFAVFESRAGRQLGPFRVVSYVQELAFIAEDSFLLRRIGCFFVFKQKSIL